MSQSLMLAITEKAFIIDEYRPGLAPFKHVYRDSHRNPELSGLEVRTASISASHLEGLDGFLVHRGVGGHGVVGILENGPVSAFLLRADKEALPHLEKTNLEYASTKIAKDCQGNETPVMHACGHDMHTISIRPAATLLHAASTTWKGTLICLFQPDEETAGGAQAMVDNNFYDTKRHVPISKSWKEGTNLLEVLPHIILYGRPNRTSAKRLKG